MLRTVRTRPVGWTLGLCTAVVLTLAGCSSDTGGGDPGRPALAEPSLPPQLAEAVDGALPALPLDGYVVSQADSVLLQRVSEERLSRCMQEKGFAYTPAPPPAARPATVIDPDRLGLLSAAAAAATGYRRPPQQGGLAPAEQDPATPAYNIALRGWAKAPDVGVPTTGGCLADVQKELGGVVQPAPGKQVHQEVVGQLRQQALAATERDSRVKAAMAAWADCMKSQGYDYPNPAAPLAAAWPDPVGGRELETAKADLRCKGQVVLLGTWYAVEAGYQQELISTHEGDLAGVKEFTDRQVAAARRLLAAG